MGRPFLLEFDKTPVNEFYQCRKCNTHIALQQDHKFNDANDELKGPIFEKAINWYSFVKEPTRTIGDFVVAQIYCNNCCYPLGFQFIEILDEFEILVKKNYFLLHLSKFLMWDGYNIVDPSQAEVGPNPVEVEDDGDDEAGPNPVEVEDDGDDEVGPNPVEVEDDGDDNNN